jgi:hypothetical protein
MPVLLIFWLQWSGGLVGNYQRPGIHSCSLKARKARAARSYQKQKIAGMSSNQIKIVVKWRWNM